MSIKASASVTLSSYRDTEAVTRYYKLVSSTASAPSKPTTNPPSGWDDTEPSYTSGSTNTLYFCDLTEFSDGTWAYSAVSKSSSYEAAKEAYNKAQNAQDTANSANGKIDGLEIGGRNLAQRTSSSFTNAYTSFTGVVNICPPLARVLTDGLSIGDTVTIRLIYKYTNIVAASGQTAKCWIQGSGDVTGWGNGAFDRSPSKTLSGSGEYEFLYSFKITAGHLKNSYWNTSIRHDYVQSGSVQWKMFKVEKGNEATDWTPAPEDMVDKANIVSCINQTPESITIQANKISLEGLITANGGFMILEDGSMETIAGKIGGWSIDENSLSSHKDSVSITEPEGSSEYYTLVGDVSMKVNSDALCIESTFNYVSTPCDAIEDAGITKGIRSIEINSAKNTVELTNKETYNEFFPDDVPVILKAVLSPDDLEFTMTDTSGTDKFSVKELFRHFRSKNLSDIYVYSGRVSFLNSSYYNNTTTYGRTIKFGASDMGYYIDDTYWLSMDYAGKLALGVQINGAKYPSWVLK